MDKLSIGQLATAAEVGIETIRYYEREGLITAAGRTAGNYRYFDHKEVQRLQFIRRAQQLGFKLAECRSLLDLQEGGSRVQVRQLASRHLADIQARIADLQRMQAILSQALADCSGKGSTADCPIISAIQAGAPAAARVLKELPDHV